MNLAGSLASKLIFNIEFQMCAVDPKKERATGRIAGPAFKQPGFDKANLASVLQQRITLCVSKRDFNRILDDIRMAGIPKWDQIIE
jgi:hypothetical protein